MWPPKGAAGICAVASVRHRARLGNIRVKSGTAAP
jgi:hypothetical protein